MNTSLFHLSKTFVVKTGLPTDVKKTETPQFKKKILNNAEVSSKLANVRVNAATPF